MNNDMINLYREYLNEKLQYDQQLEFKSFVCGALNINRDYFYFDSVYGVDTKTCKHINGLLCDGSITWKKALSILKKHFKVAV